MDLSDKEALREAVNRLAALHPLPSELLTDYLSGRRDRLLYYEKVSGRDAEEIPALWKYLLAAEGYLAQPSVDHYYDIFRAARAVPIVRRLAEAIGDLDPKRLPRSKINRLAAETSYDAFDQSMFEVVVAHAYRRTPGVEDVEFLEEGSTPTPDLRVTGSGVAVCVECKKFDRWRDIAGPLRDDVNSRLATLFAALHNANVSAVVELDITEASGNFDPREVADAALASCRTGAAILTSTATVHCRLLPRYSSTEYVLNPSPFFLQRYGYASRSEWLGFVHRMKAELAGPSWIDDIEWDVAVKWKLRSPAYLDSRRKLGHKRLFHGLRQLSTTTGPTVLHVCYEREGGVGHRGDELQRFVSRVRAGLANRQIVPPSFLVFNELDIDVSTGGRFDFIERAHWCRFDPLVRGAPAVSVVFTPPEDAFDTDAEWGVGTDLPSIDG